MTDPEERFPNLAKLLLAHDLFYFLDWALATHGVQLSDSETGESLDPAIVVSDFVEIDQARLDEEMLRMSLVIQAQGQTCRSVN